MALAGDVLITEAGVVAMGVAGSTPTMLFNSDIIACRIKASFLASSADSTSSPVGCGLGAPSALPPSKAVVTSDRCCWKALVTAANGSGLVNIS